MSASVPCSRVCKTRALAGRRRSAARAHLAQQRPDHGNAEREQDEAAKCGTKVTPPISWRTTHGAGHGSHGLRTLDGRPKAMGGEAGLLRTGAASGVAAGPPPPQPFPAHQVGDTVYIWQIRQIGKEMEFGPDRKVTMRLWNAPTPGTRESTGANFRQAMTSISEVRQDHSGPNSASTATQTRNRDGGGIHPNPARLHGQSDPNVGRVEHSRALRSLSPTTPSKCRLPKDGVRPNTYLPFTTPPNPQA